MFTVSIAVAADVPVMVADEGTKLTVGGYCPPEGPEVTDAVSATVPMKPCAGVMVIVDVFPLVAPGDTARAVPATVRNGLLDVTTCTEDEVTGA